MGNQHTGNHDFLYITQVKTAADSKAEWKKKHCDLVSWFIINKLQPYLYSGTLTTALRVSPE